MTRRFCAIGLLLAGCAGSGSGDWQKPGVGADATAREIRDCRDLTDTAVKTQADIDEDIAASRASDLQHSSIVRTQQQLMRDSTRDRAATIIASCMQAKGFTQAR